MDGALSILAVALGLLVIGCLVGPARPQGRPGATRHTQPGETVHTHGFGDRWTKTYTEPISRPRGSAQSGEGMDDE